jgi:hypothetical protein
VALESSYLSRSNFLCMVVLREASESSRRVNLSPSKNSELLWMRLLKAKYGVNELFFYNPVGCSPFWHIIHKIKNHFRLGG